ncbi:enoyl-CoA hydratase [Psychrobacter phenylpyruvicus]|uniref:Enoyl-CoA hydratase n=1 Tax=Psychrobacter phenylpyruvicus TaxID=29432 RepID=A0A379LNB6_9GAMM|nr:enoyl-CoA hydratase [Psychrobacter phenylpyruvicus]
MAKAIPYLLTGKPFNAATAEELNLVSEAVATGKQHDRAYELTVEISNAAPLGVQALLASALDGTRNGADSAFGNIHSFLPPMFHSEGAK